MNFDTWEDTESALRANTKLFVLLHNNEPPKQPKKSDPPSPAQIVWEAELKEIRKWAISIHYRRIALMIEYQKTIKHSEELL